MAKKKGNGKGNKKGKEPPVKEEKRPTWTCQSCGAVHYSGDDYSAHLDKCAAHKLSNSGYLRGSILSRRSPEVWEDLKVEVELFTDKEKTLATFRSQNKHHAILDQSDALPGSTVFLLRLGPVPIVLPCKGEVSKQTKMSVPEGWYGNAKEEATALRQRAADLVTRAELLEAETKKEGK